VNVVGLAVASFARRALLAAQLLRAEELYAIERNQNPPAQLLEWLPQVARCNSVVGKSGLTRTGYKARERTKPAR
jgi:hypothetical protein